MKEFTVKNRFRRALRSVCLLFGLCIPMLSPAASVLRQAPETHIIAGEVVDQRTGQAIAYASIGIVGEVPGTVSSEAGKFSFRVPASLQSKTVRCSALGYQPQELKVGELLTAMAAQKAVRIALVPQAVQLAEVNIKATKWKTKNLGGHAGQRAMIHHDFALSQLPLQENFGNEMGIRMNSGRRLAFLQQLNFCLSSNPYEMVKFRVNVYSVNAGVPFENVSPRDIYVTVQNKQQGWIAVDLAPYNLYVEQDFVLALEWIDCLPKEESLSLTIPGALPGFHAIYHKDTSQGNWRKLPPMGMGMNVVVQCEK
ncbi:carboxypeptidase-like regulatory domain-containing protein [Hymenobacter guriensis]|uniref:Carboxypeptidase-like regulatory domain-containing protein n=1 Tax=Hymenobacter guriensis TaxID=2793065 RepID=A0ABS0L4F7_9BACT|nr:carboxypeptidase-like regulatory domain-containing protein [Hymenobacter guriensis]MBG8555026.1 carboxypeptidase-like regulatory domain-containing protein [Hymenobacter guriensis]